MSHSQTEAPLLAVDSGSPRVSVAVGGREGVRAEVREPVARSSASLLALIDRALAAAGVDLADLSGVLALRGPGSFTGLRVGLATVLGLHQARRLPAAALPTLEVLASLGPGDGSTVVAAVDALRGEWFTQPFRSTPVPQPLAPPALLPATRLSELGPALLVGFGIGGLGGLEPFGLRTLEPGSLAAAAVVLASRRPPSWDSATLIDPLYLRPPAAKPVATRPPGASP